MAVIIDVNTNEMIALTNKLKQLHRSAFPLAVRGTLNDLAFDNKQNTLQSQVAKSFTIRKPSFFRAFSGVRKAGGGFDVKTMSSTVGMKSKGQIAGKNLLQQEIGGKLKGKRSLVPLDEVRVSRNKRKIVKKKFRTGKEKGGLSKFTLHRSFMNNSSSKKQQFVKTVLHFAKEDKPPNLFIINEAGKLIQIKKIIKKGKYNVIVSEKIYSYKHNRSINVKGRGYLRKSGKQSAAKVKVFYTKNARKQFKRLAS